MSLVPKSLVPFVYLALLTACASGEPVDQRYAPAVKDDPRPLQCGPGRVAVCVEANCDPAEYVCAEQSDLRGLFEPRRHQ